jgi:hypothetical protein
MTEVLDTVSPRLGVRRTHGRVTNAMAGFLRNRLSVPDVYIEPRIAGVRPDILAVDRAGSGDLHGIEIKILAIFPTRSQLRSLLLPLREMPFHFKYLAIPGFLPDLSDGRKFAGYTELFDETGIGRFGVISFDHRILDASTLISTEAFALTVRPERFLVRGEKLEAVEHFLAKAKPDMKIRL